MEHNEIDLPPPYEDSSDAWKIYADDHGCFMKMTLVPETTSKGPFDVPWEVELRVLTPDIAHLMRQGFHWDKTNIHQEKGFLTFKDSLPASAKRSGWTMSRHYFLAASAENFPTNPWRAQLCVYARDMGTLSSFKIEHLSVEKILSCHAWNLEGWKVYNYNAKYPEQLINVYYDDMPMSGWWPRPKGNRLHGDMLEGTG